MYNFIKNHKVKLVYLPLAVYWVILLALTSFPTKSLPTVAISDKIKHFIAYFVLSVLLKLTLHFQEKYKLSLKNCAFLTLGIVAFYGMLDEIHQYFIPGRYCEVFDWVANVVGGIAGVLIVRFFIVKNRDNALEAV